MPRGGHRQGSGRKTGAQNKNTVARKVIEDHAASLPEAIHPDIAAMTPLQVMLRAMAISANGGDWDGASDHAAKAAPFVHPRLAAVEMSGKDGKPIGFVLYGAQEAPGASEWLSQTAPPTGE